MHRIVLFSSYAFNPNLDTVLDLIFPQELSVKKFGFIPANGVSSLKTGYLDYWQSVAKEKKAEFYLIDNDPSQSAEDLELQKEILQNVNIIIISEGDTYNLLENMRKTGLDQYVITFWEKSNCILAGFSAGALFLTPSVNINKIRPITKEEYRRYPEVKLKGLNLVNFTVFPHYDKYRDKPILDEYRNTYPTEIKALPDDHWYLIEK